jgi:hypothetical protein
MISVEPYYESIFQAAENYQANAGIINDDCCEISVPRGTSFYFIPFVNAFYQTKDGFLRPISYFLVLVTFYYLQDTILTQPVVIMTTGVMKDLIF